MAVTTTTGPLVRALRRVEAQLDMAGWDELPRVYAIYQDDPERPKYQLREVPAPPQTWMTNDVYGVAGKLYSFAHTFAELRAHPERARDLGLDMTQFGLIAGQLRLAPPKNWRGFAFVTEMWEAEARTPEERKRLMAAGLERAIHLLPNRTEIRVAFGQLASGENTIVRRQRGLPGVEVAPWTATGGLFLRALRLLCGLPEFDHDNESRMPFDGFVRQ